MTTGLHLNGATIMTTPTPRHVEIARATGQLRAAGYEGPWSLETFNPEYWWADPLDVAIEGRSRLDRLLERPARSGPGEAPWST